MPLSRYNKAFGGKRGAAAKAHAAMAEEYGAKKGEEVFYATKNKRMRAKSHAGHMGEKDYGVYRQEEGVKAGGFKDGQTVHACRAIPDRPFAKAK